MGWDGGIDQEYCVKPKETKQHFSLFIDSAFLSDTTDPRRFTAAFWRSFTISYYPEAMMNEPKRFNYNMTSEFRPFMDSVIIHENVGNGFSQLMVNEKYSDALLKDPNADRSKPKHPGLRDGELWESQAHYQPRIVQTRTGDTNMGWAGNTGSSNSQPDFSLMCPYQFEVKRYDTIGTGINRRVKVGIKIIKIK